MRRRLLRPYQKQALQYCLSKSYPALFMEMRLGKTIVAIRWVQTLKFKKVLVVAPTSALFSWEDELRLEGENDFTYLIGANKAKALALKTSKAKWFLLNKEGFLTFQVSRNNYDSLFTEYPWDAIILDESTFIRRPTTKVSKFYTRHFRHIDNRMIMSGLPNPEHLLDFFQQFLFLDNGASFGNNYRLFKLKRFRPQGNYLWTPRAHTHEFIKSTVKANAFVLRRKHVNLEQPIVREKRYAIMPENLRKTYVKAENEFLLEYENKELDRTVYKIAAYSWLRHIASGFVKDKFVWKGKLNLVVELLEDELKNEPLIIWFDYNEGLFQSRRLLIKKGYNVRTVVGNPIMSIDRRRLSIKQWKRGDAQILLAQPRCLQYGVDLSRAATEIFFTSPLSNELRTQSQERIIKSGNKHPLLCLDLITKNTIDEDIYRLMLRKNRTAINVLDACRAIKERRTS